MSEGLPLWLVRRTDVGDEFRPASGYKSTVAVLVAAHDRAEARRTILADGYVNDEEEEVWLESLFSRVWSIADTSIYKNPRVVLADVRG